MLKFFYKQLYITISRYYLIFLLTLSFLNVNGISPGTPDPSVQSIPDSMGNQILYNGRVWRNLYYHVKGDQFLFTSASLHGTVTMEGTEFRNLMIQYDIYKDEILTPTNHACILQLNKEKVDQFTLEYLDRIYFFRKFETDSVTNLSGYVNILYNGTTSLLVKYKKELLFLAYENEYDLFNQIHRIYIMKGGKIFPANSKKELFDLLRDHKQELKTYIKSRKLQVTKKDPESFIPVLEYYDNLNLKG